MADEYIIETENVDTMSIREKEAEELCRWAAARAGSIVVLPIAGTIALVANEVYMIQRLAKLYGYTINEKMVASFIGGLGGAFVGQTLATMIPFPPMQIPIGIAVTYGVGKAAHLWIKAGMPEGKESYKNAFKEGKENCKALIADLKTHVCREMPLGDENKKFKI